MSDANLKVDVKQAGDCSRLDQVTGGKVNLDKILADINQIGVFGTRVNVAPNGAQSTENVVRLTGGNFITGRPLLSHLWTEAFVNGGSSDVVEGVYRLSTNTTANGRATVETRRKGRFITETFNFTHQAIRTPAPDNIDVKCRWGPYDPLSALPNGSFIENLEGVITLNRIKNGVIQDSKIAAGLLVSDPVETNGPDRFVKDANIHIYHIYINAGIIYWLQDLKLIHVMPSPTSAAFESPHLKLGWDIENLSGNTTNNLIETRGSGYHRFGANNAIPDFFQINAVGGFLIKNTPGRLHKINITNKALGAAVVDVYNGIDATGELLTTIDTFNVFGPIPFDTEFDDGLFVDVAGNNNAITIMFD